MDIYEEFADTDKSKWPFVFSDSARKEIARLIRQHSFTYNFNPGGASIEKRSGEVVCQISTEDDVLDLARLREAISKLGL